MRLSATLLESFRLWMNEDWMTTERFIDDLTKPFETSYAADLGKAFHKLNEGNTEGPPYRIELECGDIAKFDRTCRLPEYPKPITEQKMVKVIDGHQIVGMIDGGEGSIIHDIKTSQKPFNADKFADSMQWRVYLEIFQADKCVFDFCQLYQPGKRKGDTTWSVKDRHTLPLYRYPKLGDDVRRHINMCVSHLQLWELDEYVKERPIEGLAA